jgi:hypothetical protein
VFSYVAHVIRSGGLPYRDVWDIKPPGIYLIYRAILGIAGPSMPAVRAADLVWTCATCLALFALGRRFFGPIAAAAAAVWYAAAYFRLEYWAMAQAESFAALPVVLALACWWHAWERRSPPLFLTAGILAGLAATLKFTTALPLVVPIVITAALGRRSESDAGAGFPRRVTIGAVLAALGVLAPLSAALLWMQSTGIWDAYVEIQRGFVAQYVTLNLGSLPVRGLRHTSEFLIRYVIPIGLAAAGIVGLRRQGAGLPLLFTAGWALAAVAAVWAQGKFFRYHWTVALPPLCLLAGAGSELAGRALRARLPWARVAAVALALPVLWSIWSSGPDYLAAARRLSGATAPRVYLTRFGAPGRGDFSFVEDLMAAQYVRAARASRTGLFVWGFEPLVYLLSGSRPPTRFIFAVPLVAPWAPAKWREELMRDLRAHPPEIILVVTNYVYPWASGRAADSAALLKEFPELHAFIQSRYQFQQVIEDFIVYRIR